MDAFPLLWISRRLVGLFSLILIIPVVQIDLFVLSCGMQFPPHDAIIKRDVSIRSTFCVLRVGVQYRSLWQLRSRSKHASSSSIPYFVFKWYRYENQTLALRPELCSMCIRVWRRDIQQVEVNVFSGTRRWLLGSSYSLWQDYTFSVPWQSNIL